MDGKEKDPVQDTPVNPEELEKALENALDATLQKSDDSVPKEVPEEDLEKSEEENKEEKEKEEEGGEDKGESEESTDNEDDGEVNKSEDELDFDSLSKSIPEILEEDSEASDVVDAIPFVKALVDSVDGQLVELTKAIVYLADKVETLEATVNKNNGINKAQAELVKSISERVGEMGGQVMPRKAFIGKKITIMKKSDGEEDETIELTKSQALEGLTELCKSNKLDMYQVAQFESIINQGRELPESVTKLIASTINK